MSDNGREPQAHRQQQQSPQPIAHGSYHDDQDAAAAAPELPRFEPIFTLLTNSSTNETIHPRVRYLFADDDPSSIIAHEADHNADASSPGAAAHRTLVVDLAPRDPSSTTTNNTTANNWSVSWAASLSPDFAITDSHLLPMQQGDHPDTTTSTTNPGAHNGSSSSSPNGGLMLRIDGVEREPVDVRGGPSASSSNSLPGSSGSATAAAGREDVEALVDDFRRRMGVLKKVVGEGERRREAVRAEQERHEQQHEHPPEGAAGSPGLDADAEGVEEHDHMRDSG
ncbi:unnamed protein product [Clonostachys byssicola]|uniref:Uncharacterized protein n=1 Tax=Clonostachys byssicola TaxID=160290 RepID=A0A9N9Y1I8_9HYPO|nr:unnamed protein product [Clonostachys byssicola]